MIPEILFQHIVRFIHTTARRVTSGSTQWSFSWVKQLTVMAIVLLLTLWSLSCVSQKPSMSNPQEGIWQQDRSGGHDSPYLPRRFRDRGFEIATS